MYVNEESRRREDEQFSVRKSHFEPPYFEASVPITRRDVLALVFIGTCLTKRVCGSPGRHPAAVGFPDCLYGRPLNREVLCICFIRLTTCFGHCGPSSGHENV